VKPERIAYSHLSGPVFDATVTFTAEGKKTRVDMRMVFDSVATRNKVATEFGAVEGLQQTLTRLGEHVARVAAGETDDVPFTFGRTFDAPRDLMFRIWTEAEHLKNWFGPKGATIIAAKNDLRPGGVFHYGMRMPDGKEIWGKWVYGVVVRPERIEFLNSFSDSEGGLTRHPFSPDWPRELRTKITFTEKNGKTTVTVEWSPLPNATEVERNTFNDARPSMTMGWTGTFEQLESYLATQV
jgi:uncharacterized protein YndB with AHSA1/START domain